MTQRCEWCGAPARLRLRWRTGRTRRTMLVCLDHEAEGQFVATGGLRVLVGLAA